MNKCYLASKNPAKLNAVKTVLTNFEVIDRSVDSKVSNQPMSDSETINGAYNRASSLDKDGLRIGLEAGIQRHGDIFYLVNWGVLIDPDDNVYYAGGARLPLPTKVIEKIIEDNSELAVVMDALFDENDIRSKEGAMGIFTSNQVKRVDIFIQIVKSLYGQYLYKQKR